jgi:hypothetical protein
LTFEEYIHPLNDDWQVYLDRNVNDVQFNNDFQEIAVSAYRHSDKFFLHGIITCIYVLIGFDCIIDGLNAVFAKTVDEKVKGWSTAWVLPVIIVVYDLELRRIYKRMERWPLVIIKALVWSFFIFNLIAAIATENST